MMLTVATSPAGKTGTPARTSARGAACGSPTRGVWALESARATVRACRIMVGSPAPLEAIPDADADAVGDITPADGDVGRVGEPDDHVLAAVDHEVRAHLGHQAEADGAVVAAQVLVRNVDDAGLQREVEAHVVAPGLEARAGDEVEALAV